MTSAVPIRNQLAHLDRLVGAHESYWTAVAQYNPRSTAVREFLRSHWDPWFMNWALSRPQLDRQRTVVDERGSVRFEPVSAPADAIATFVREAAQGLTAIRELAARSSIPMPDLGTAQYGFVRRQEPLIVQTKPAAKVSGDEGELPMDDADVGHWFWPLALGLPAGALGGYHYRKWQETHPGQLIPWISGEADPSVGGPWVDIVGAEADASAGAWPWHTIQDIPGPGFVPYGPWINIVGAQAADSVQQRAWQTTRALIQSAINEALDAYAMSPAQAYVWSLDPPGPSPAAHVELTGTTMIIPFASSELALAYMRDRIQTPHVALALFDATSPRWPNPVNWTKSYDPAHEAVIAQQIAKHAPTQTAGEIVGTEPWQSIVGTEPWQSIVGTEPWQSIVGTEPWQSIVGTEPWQSIVGTEPWQTIVGQAIAVLRRQAKVAAEEMPGRAIGVRRGPDNRWVLKAFRSADDADDWFGRAIAEPGDFTYAAYFSKDRHGIPFLENEEIGKADARSSSRELVSVTVSP